MRQALAVALVLAVAVAYKAAHWWVPLVPLVPLVPIAVRVAWDSWRFIRTQVIPLFMDD
jgi:hypothetical protein